MCDLGLDMGCGENKRERFIGLDLKKTVCVDIIADARLLPFRNESFYQIYSSHLIEHFSHRELNGVLTEWVRVLRKGGIFEIRCPDLRARSFLFFLNPSWQNVTYIYGEQDHAGNYHKCGFSYNLLKKLLESCGIRSTKRVVRGYKGIPFLPDCLHLRGIKS